MVNIEYYGFLWWN